MSDPIGDKPPGRRTLRTGQSCPAEYRCLNHLAVQLFLRLARRASAPLPLATCDQADEHGVDPDAVSAEVLGGSLGYGQASSTGGSGRQRRSPSGLGAYVEHIDDGSATGRDQVRHSQAGAANGCEHLEVKVGDPVVVGDLIDPSSGALARVVHETVEAAPSGDGRINKSFKVSRVSDIGLHRKCITPGVT